MPKHNGKVQLRVVSNSIFTDCTYNCNGNLRAIPNERDYNIAINNCIITDNNTCLTRDDYGRIVINDCNIIIVPIRPARETPTIYCNDTDDDGGNDDCANLYAMARTTSDTSEYQM